MRVRARDKLRAQASREAPHAEASAALVQLMYTGTTQPWHRWERAVKSRSCYRVSCVHVYARASRTLSPLLNQSPPMWVRALFFFLFFLRRAVCLRTLHSDAKKTPIWAISDLFIPRSETQIRRSNAELEWERERVFLEIFFQREQRA